MHFILLNWGIGMSALAKFLLDQGAIVGGYDKTPSAVTDSLEKQGCLFVMTIAFRLLLINF